jgi:L-malate glycosyltransferase
MLTKTLSQKGQNVCVISINDDCSGDDFETPTMHLRNLTPFLFPTLNSRFSNSSLKFSNNYGSKCLSLLKNLNKIKNITREENSQLIHFIDNYGPIMTGLSKKTKLPLSIFAPTYHRRHQFYDNLLKASLLPFTKVITTTNSFKNKMVKIGIAPEKIEVIHWGVDTDFIKPNFTKREQTREKLGIDSDSKLILWSGFLQQIGIGEFQYSLEIANECLKRNSNCRFIFALKNVHFKEEYRSYEKRSIKIITSYSNSEFLKLVNASDAFLSPILSTSSIVAPPLTWIECMALGVPVISTNVEGSNELILNDETGYTFNSIQEASEKINAILADENLHKQISQAAREKVRVEFNIEGIANKYLGLWKEMAEGRR